MPVENGTAFINYSLSPLFRIMSVIQLFTDSYSFIDQLLRNTIECSVLNISLYVKFEVVFRIWIEVECLDRCSFFANGSLY